MRYHIFKEILNIAQNYWSADHMEADSPLCTITLLQDSTINRTPEESNPTINLPNGNMNITSHKPQNILNISDLVEQFKNLALNHLVSRPPIICNNCRRYGYYA